ncbi:MAG: sigma-70 family RNA polymerase sigma factor [Actinomycetes bacterium]
MPHRQTPDPADLPSMGTDQLFESFLAYREAGERESAMLCIQLFAWQMFPALIARVKRRYPDLDAEDFASEAIESVIEWTDKDDNEFDGEKPAQLHKFVYVVLDRRIAEFFRMKARREEIATTVSLDAGSGPEGQSTILDAFPDEEDGFNDVELAEIREAVMAELNPEHREVIGYVYAGYRSREIAEITGLTVANIDQIRHRYRELKRKAMIEVGLVADPDEARQNEDDGDDRNDRDLK